MPFKYTCSIYTMITLGHRRSLNKFQRISVINSMFSNKKAIKFEINKKILKNDGNMFQK